MMNSKHIHLNNLEHSCVSPRVCSLGLTDSSQDIIDPHVISYLSAVSFVFLLFFFSPFPSYTSGVHHFWVRFLRMWPFFNPTIKVVTFRLRGWCMLGVFLLPAFTRLGHERQGLLSPCDEMYVCTD